jgi:hypothetical protein
VNEAGHPPAFVTLLRRQLELAQSDHLFKESQTIGGGRRAGGVVCFFRGCFHGASTRSNFTEGTRCSKFSPY